MANYETMIPFILHFAAGVPASSMGLPLNRQFEIARKKGWSDDPDDPGGATMIDITLKTYASYRRARGFRVTTKDQLLRISFDEWKEILKSRFWDSWRADEIESAGLAHLLVDWIWASGPSTIRVAQRIIGVKADGIVGPITIGAINRTEPEILFKKIRNEREVRYRRCRGAWKYLRGWLRRLNAIRSDGTFLIS